MNQPLPPPSFKPVPKDHVVPTVQVLSDDPPARVYAPAGPSISTRFEIFNRLNPEVYGVLIDLARRSKASGMKVCGISMLWEVMRWELALVTKGNEKFRLNNNFRSAYSRLIMEQEPDLKGFFHTRRQTAK